MAPVKKISGNSKKAPAKINTAKNKKTPSNKAVSQTKKAPSEETAPTIKKPWFDSRKCSYCNKSFKNKELTNVTTNAKKLKIWVQRLGPKFAKTVSEHTYNRVCKTHMEGEGMIRNSLPKKLWDKEENDEMNVEEEYTGVLARVMGENQNGEEVEMNVDGGEEEQQQIEEQNDVVEMLPPKKEIVDDSQVAIVVKKEGETGLVKILPPGHKNSKRKEHEVQIIEEANVIVKCRKCGCYANQNTMAKTPEDFETMQIWFKHLGKEFFKNYSRSADPHYVCGRDMKELCAKIMKQ